MGDSPQERYCNLLAQVFDYWKRQAFKAQDFLATCPTNEVELTTLEKSATSWHELAWQFADHVLHVAIQAAHHVDHPNPFNLPKDRAGVVTRAQEQPERYWPAIARSLHGCFKLTDFEADKLERFVDLEWERMEATGNDQHSARSDIRAACQHAICLVFAAAPPTPPANPPYVMTVAIRTVNVDTNCVMIDGKEFTVLPHQARMLDALVKADGAYVTGPKLQELPACLGKNIYREFAQLKKQIPPINSLLKSAGNRGYYLAR